MSDYLLVSTATATRDEGTALAESAVRARLAASAQVIGPVATAFWHLGEFGTGEEWQVVLKTTAARYLALEVHLLERHPWDNPEVTAIPLVAGATRCLEWLAQSVAER